MGQTEYADSFVQSMFSWIRWFANQITAIFQSNQSVATDGIIGWFAANWLKMLLILIVSGVVIDWLVWMIRWRPYWLWFRRKRIVLDDDFDDYLEENFDDLEAGDFFEEEALMPEENKKLRFHSNALKKKGGRQAEDEFDDPWEEDLQDDYDAYEDEDFQDFDEAPRVQQDDGWGDGFDEEKLWDESAAIKPEKPLKKKGLFRGIPFKKLSLPEPAPEDDLDEYDEFFQAGAQEDDEDMLLYSSEAFEPTEGFNADESDGDMLYDENEDDDAETPEIESDILRGSQQDNSGDASALSLYARPVSTEPAEPANLDDNEPWRTGYTVRIPKIDENTPSLSRKARRKLREIE